MQQIRGLYCLYFVYNNIYVYKKSINKYVKAKAIVIYTLSDQHQTKNAL